MAKPEIPLPRSAIEVPLYVLARWRVWPPLRVLLGLPYRDLEERLRPPSHRVLVVSSPHLVGDVAPNQGAASAHPAAKLIRAAAGVDMVLESSIEQRTGPRRGGPRSLQLIPDIGIDLPAPAIAWMLAWRDLGVLGARLGTSELRRPDGGWHQYTRSLAHAVRKQRQRIRSFGGDLRPRWSEEFEERAINAVVAARGTARLCQGGMSDEALERLVRRALRRYAQPGIELSAIALPNQDPYRYEHSVREIARAFVAPGATPTDYGGELRHRIVRRRRARGNESQPRTERLL